MSLTRTEMAARAALQARLGKGARFDAPNAPADDLLMARRGTAYFARKLSHLPDDDLHLPSAVPGLTRAQVVVRVSYDARLQALALEALVKGVPLDVPGDVPAPRVAASLPARALRHLFQHSDVHLNVCWRDLSDDQWDMTVALADGTTITARALPLIRAKSIWRSGVDLGNGGRVKDIPASLLSGETSQGA